MQDTPAEQRHVPVLLDRCLDLLAPGFDTASPIALDATLGMGGHTEAMLERFPHLTVVGIDRDPQALELAGERLARFGDRFLSIHTTYDNVADAAAVAGVETVDGVLFDLGVSSLQLDERERGFAYSFDAPLDMRMNSQADFTAETVVNEYEEDQLRDILRNWGEERFAPRIARAIVAARAVKPLTTTGELVEVVKSAVPMSVQHKKGHPAKQTFQALRIEVNEELDVLSRAIPAALETLRVGGRVVAMSYHSLEDKIVKQEFARGARSSAPKGFPVELPEHQPTLKVLTRGAERPTEEETATNPRAASARLRAVEKVRTTMKSGRTR
ncbi:16S rRNA (cytosine(1402)-N(4))-methyltransferase RsmH [Kocuria sp. cx-455]|uniref:16S rRNA (cytosine(1402)-N(4))-methyltransferase RsmH n=1 Tax=Kocuria sp. cx-455 TaxID=2771377 RepID=UPI0016897BEB|nr:16S rRNA (cytosine(1402)-N(4))-methyltransferase RsmH [Kocuria sp. cx-455]MBD2765609.1 16S rRNA (cytosine(1402)-N(4))-methyltransferase RsmH [Kocuria sp. cx-455]